jgi:predicted transcriptional regulator of viral defense system
MKFSDYIKNVRSKGYYTFTKQEALAKLGISSNAFNCGMYKLKKKGEIVSPARNLYVIIPPEHQSVGCIPIEELVPILMQHWHLPYYACLLSAAGYHGAAHQKPQIFQVMTNKQLKLLHCGKFRVDFVYKKNLENCSTQAVTVKTGYLNISPPELTAMDLLTYPRHAGGLNHIATVLSELVEVMDPEALIKLVNDSSEKAWAQRLGYILEQVETMDEENQNHIVNLLHQAIQASMSLVPLAPELLIKGKERNHRWMIIENTTVESDL